MKTKEMTFANGKAETAIPENIRIVGVYDGKERIPHRVLNKTLEIKKTLSKKLTVHYEKVRPVVVAAMYPFQTK